MIKHNELITKIVKEYKNLLIIHKYPRPDRLEAIFKFWITSILVINDDYKLPSKKILNLQKWFFNSIQLDLKRDLDRHERKIKKNLKRRIIFALSHIPFLHNSLLPGGQSLNSNFIEKVLSMTLLNKLQRVDVSVNKDLRENYLSIISSLVNKKTHEVIETSMPDFFFYNIIHKKLPLKYIGSMSIIFDEDLPFNKIFFQEPPPYIIGYIHGGFYGEYLKNRVEDLEKSVADEYMGWGLEHRNVIPNRFQVTKTENRIVRKLFLIGSAPGNLMLESYFYGLKPITKNANRFMNELKKNLDIHYIIHPSINEIPPDFLFQNTSYYSEVDEEEINNSLFIFDRPGHTTLYKCIYESIPFMIILNEDWEVFLKPKYIKFLEFLSSINLLYWQSQDTEFYKELSLYKNGKIFEAIKFTQIRNFLEKG